MWPGQQPGGEQHQQQPNPYQQQPAPHGPQGYDGQQQHQQQEQWGQSAPPGAPVPGKSGTSPRVAVAIIGAVALIAAAAVTGVVLLNEDDGGGGKASPAGGGGSPSASSSPSPSPSEKPVLQDDPDNPRGVADDQKIEPVVSGWKAVYNAKRHNVYDVPPEWEVQSPTMTIGFEDDSGPLVSMTGAALYKDGICKYASRAGAGTKGGIGAKNTKEAVENEAGAWAEAAFNTSKKATVEQTEPVAFSSKHGLKGHMATATVTGVPRETKCSADGKVVAFTYTDVKGEFATWVLYTDTGVDDEVPEDTIAKIMDSLRPLEG
ncbi:hypothetical protein [Streptomyces sp. CMB-StM0423]|uniref:hypothetical protein n=1 Tax=Streptomyces sp. CMB-StM0423 TaxID=2059884 RepID=UPI000C70EA80|nr:hypothetical protein [Streptomyces sp. CMB-StM0423]AUH45280.1 hypothetical protein CXR04_33455 [Streptomyces sp. CMB-StM0423]